MSNKTYVIKNKNSNQVIDGNPKLPTAEQLQYGEIAINYAAGKETIALKNSNNGIVTFSCDDKFNESFRVMSKAMCDLDDRVLALEELSAITIGDLVKTDTELGNVTTSGKVVDALLVKDINNQVDNIETSAGTFNTRITNLETSAGTFDTRLDGLETSAGTFDTRITNLETSATSIDTRVTNLETSAGTLDTRLSNLEASAITTDDIINTVDILSGLTASGSLVDAKLIRDIIYDNEETTASALNDLNDKIVEISGATPSLETTLAVSGNSAITVTVGEEISNALVVPYAVSASTITNTVTTEAELSALTQTGSYVDAKLIRDIIYDNEEVTSQALNNINEDVISLQTSATSVNERLDTIEDDIETLSGETENIIRKIENNDIAIAGALNELNGKIGDIESLLAQI